VAVDPDAADRLFRRAQRKAGAAASMRQASTLVETFPQQQGSLSRPARPKAGPASQQAAGPGLSLTVGDPCGQGLEATISGHVGAGNEPLTFATVTRRTGFAETTLPTTQIVLPCNAVYGLEVAFETADDTVGGVVGLYLNGALLQAGHGYQGAWTRYTDMWEFIGQAGDLVEVKVDHAGTSDLEYEGVVSIFGKERVIETVTDCTEFVAGLGPKGWWKLDETSGSTAVDSSGNGFDLSIAAANVTLGQPSFCCGDGSYDFAGVQGINSNWVGSGTNAFDFEGTPSFSAAIWVDLDTAGADGHLVGTHFFDANWGGWGLTVHTGNIWRFARSTSGTISVDILNVSGDIGPTNSVGIPRHIVGTYDGADMRMYVDGILKGTLASTRNVGDSALFSIGEARTPIVSQNPLNGKVCDCQVYDYRLTDAQVLDLFNATQG